MVKDLLTFSKAVGQWPVDYPVLNASDVLQDAMANLSVIIAESGAEIVADELPSVKIQRSHLLQIFQNLISNSLKYRSKDVTPRVSISALREEDEWIFSVGDNGIGFDSHYARRIFGMFKRLHGKGEYAGTGIGLSICARIVAHYGGRIWAESQPGQGATFRFALPVYDEESRNGFEDGEVDSEKDLTSEATWRPSVGRPREIAS
jgi:light-regulated signal transduction histidine kinase (bacteriophytochrome)